MTRSFGVWFRSPDERSRHPRRAARRRGRGAQQHAVDSHRDLHVSRRGCEPGAVQHEAQRGSEQADRVSYEGHEYEVLTAAEQLIPGGANKDAAAAARMRVRLRPIDRSAGCS